MSGHRWLRMLHNRYPPQLKEMTQTESDQGIRLLSEGLFKYLPFTKPSEFYDRLFFVYAMHPLIPGKIAPVRQADAPPSLPAEIFYTVPIKPDLEPFLQKQMRRLKMQEEEDKLKVLIKGKCEWWGSIPGESLASLDSRRFRGAD